MLSMTGFGRGICELGGRRFVVEIRSVNHRFLELKTRLPWPDPLVEAQLGAAVRRRLGRGALTVAVRDEGGGASPLVEVKVDEALGRAYAVALSRLAAACGLQEQPTLSLIAAQPGVLATGAQEAAGDDLWARMAPAVEASLDELLDSRAREGEALREDLLGRVVALRRIVADLARLAAEAPVEARRRLEDRLRKLLPAEGSSGPGLAGVQVDPQRLAQEVAILADRADITEEVTRFHTHLDEVDRLLAGSEPAGRRLDFLAQELHREINTMGSKSQRAEIASRVIDAKTEVERLREQVQNVE
jgi:uncharacterized protein (TIGR00255 family)